MVEEAHPLQDVTIGDVVGIRCIIFIFLPHIFFFASTEIGLGSRRCEFDVGGVANLDDRQTGNGGKCLRDAVCG